MEKEIEKNEVRVKGAKEETPIILEEVTIEELAVDGVCGIY